MRYDSIPVTINFISVIHSRGNYLYCYAREAETKHYYPVMIGFSAKKPQDDIAYKLIFSSSETINRRKFYRKMYKLGSKKISYKTFLTNKQIIVEAFNSSKEG